MYVHIYYTIQDSTIVYLYTVMCFTIIHYTVLRMVLVRPLFILRIVRPNIIESTFRNYCAKKLVGALRQPTSFM